MKVVEETLVRHNDYDSLFKKRDWVSIALVESFGVYSVIESLKYYYVNIDYTVCRSELIMEGTDNLELAHGVYLGRIEKWRKTYKEREHVHQN